jgi:hypothetical protein
MHETSRLFSLIRKGKNIKNSKYPYIHSGKESRIFAKEKIKYKENSNSNPFFVKIWEKNPQKFVKFHGTLMFNLGKIQDVFPNRKKLQAKFKFGTIFELTIFQKKSNFYIKIDNILMLNLEKIQEVLPKRKKN